MATKRQTKREKALRESYEAPMRDLARRVGVAAPARCQYGAAVCTHAQCQLNTEGK